MNNQVKLIDAVKVLKWAAEMNFEGRLIDYWGLSHEISAGKFDPETTPVPVIKPGDRVRHDIHGYGTAHAVFKGSKNVLVTFDGYQHAVIAEPKELEVSHD